MNPLSQLAGSFLPFRAVHRSFALRCPVSLSGFPKSLSHPQHTIHVHLVACLSSGQAIAHAACIASPVFSGGIYANHPLV